MEDSYHLEHRVHIYIRGRCCIVGGVKNSQNCTVLAGGHHLPAFFRSLGRATCKVPILCIYYNAIQAPADRERLRRSIGSSPARGEGARATGIINLSLQVPPRIYIHEDDGEVVVTLPSLFSHSLRSYSRRYKLPR